MFSTYCISYISCLTLFSANAQLLNIIRFIWETQPLQCPESILGSPLRWMCPTHPTLSTSAGSFLPWRSSSSTLNPSLMSFPSFQLLVFMILLPLRYLRSRLIHVSDLESLILNLVVSHSVSNHPSVRSLLVNIRTLRPPNLIPCTWLCLEILSIKVMNITGWSGSNRPRLGMTLTYCQQCETRVWLWKYRDWMARGNEPSTPYSQSTPGSQ